MSDTKPRSVRAVRSVAFLSRDLERGCRDCGVSMPQYRLLLFLRHGPRRAGELAASAAIRRPTLTALVDGLEKEAWLRRVPVEADRRGVRLELTAEGLATLRKVDLHLSEIIERTAAEGNEERLLAGFEELAEIIDGQMERHLKPGGKG